MQSLRRHLGRVRPPSTTRPRSRARPRSRTRFHIRPLTASWLVVGTLGASLVACAPAPSLAVAIDTATVDVVRGAAGEVMVTLTRGGGASGDVQLTIAGLPEHVDATFTPDTLTGAALTSSLSVSVDAAAVDGTHQVTVFAVGAGLAADTTFELTISSLDVSGTVVLANGEPWGGIEVVGPTGSTTTANDGTFSFDGLAVPYDLTLHGDQGTDWVHVFEGLTASDPLLEPVTGFSGVFLADVANLSGTLTGTAVPLPANHAARVCLEGIDRVVYACQALAAGEDGYDMQVIWPSSGTLTARLHVLAFAWNGAGDQPAAYTGYASADVVLSDGDAAVVDLALADVPSVTLQGDVVVEGGGSPDRIYAGLRFGPYLTVPLFQDGSGADTFAMPMPMIPGVSYDVAAVVGIPRRWAWKAGTGADAGTLTVPASPTPVTPDDAAVGIDTSTAFTLTSPAPSVLTYVWDGVGGAPTFARTTAATSVTMPDGAAYGIPLPGATAYEWYALRVPATGVEDATRTGYPTSILAMDMMATDLGGRGFGPDGAIASTELRDFTTAP